MKKAIFLGLALAISSGAVVVHAQATHGQDHSQHHQASGTAADFDLAKLDGKLQINQCWVRLMPGDLPSAAYFVVKNTGDTQAVLLAARSSAYDDVMVHQTTHKEGMSHMGHASSVPVPAGQELRFEPGGFHVMLEKAVKPLALDGQIDLELLFEGERKAEANCQLRSPKSQSF